MIETPQSEERSNTLKSIIQLFMRYGIKSVTMDDVAKTLGISKKTIYLQFQDKSEVVEAAVRFHLNEMQSHCMGISDQTLDPITEMQEIGKTIHNMTRQMNPTLLFDLKKYYPAAWQAINKHRTEFIEHFVLKNIERGIELGLYRLDANPKIISRLYVNIIDLIIDDEIFPKNQFTFKELVSEIMNYHLLSLVTLEGLQIIKSKEAIHE